MSSPSAVSAYVSVLQATIDDEELILTEGSGPLYFAFLAGKWHGRAEERALSGDQQLTAQALAFARRYAAKALAGADPLERA